MKEKIDELKEEFENTKHFEAAIDKAYHSDKEYIEFLNDKINDMREEIEALVRDKEYLRQEYNKQVDKIKDMQEVIDLFLEWMDTANEEINCVQNLQPTVQDDCQHEWISMKNEVIESGEYCPKCHAVRATP